MSFHMSFFIDRIIEWFAGKDIIKNGKNATKRGAEMLPWTVKCPYMTEKILEFHKFPLHREI